MNKWNKFKEGWNKFKERWNAKLNSFWNSVLKFALIVGGSAGGILTMQQMWNLTQYGVDPIIFTVCGYILTACGALGLAAKLTKE